MREEDISMINIVKNKEIGDVEFFRYFLSIGDLEKKKIPTAIFQARRVSFAHPKEYQKPDPTDFL